MKRYHLLALLFLFAAAGLFAQRIANPKAVQMTKIKPMPAVKTAISGFETTHGHQADNVPPGTSSLLDLVGSTVYDLQSNGGVGHRVYNDGAGTITGTYTLSLDANAYPDRGTGYNKNTGGAWGPDPTARIEPARTGFPSLVVSGGNEYVFSHLGAGKITMAKRPASGGAWVHTTMPSATTELWCRAAGGGPDGHSLHVIASSMPTGNGGTLFQGMDGVLLYWRSLDGGATWDKQDMLLPDIDQTTFTGTDVEGYAIDCNGSNVAIFTTNTWNDCLLYVSSDNGATWTKRVVNEFPLDKYVVNSGYDPTSLPPDPGRPATDSYAIFTCDGTADVLVDEAGFAHCWYGATYVSDSILTDQGWTYYPGLNIGIVYFNTLMDDNSGVVSGYCPDVNGNQALDVTGISNYGIGLSSHPAAAMDADGNLYVVYSTVHEENLDLVNSLNFRQPYIVGSQDFGATWTDPLPVLNPILLGSDESDIPFLEAVFNSTAKLADGKVHTIFQADYAVLTFLNSNTIDTDFGDNSIRYVGYPTPWVFGMSNTENVAAEALSFKAMPNPANDRIVIQFDSERNQESWVELFDIYGKSVRRTTPASIGVGQGTINLLTSDLPTGMYIARLNLGNAFATQKVIIKH
jgi:Secretion system C-terminal sorting domain